MMILMITLIMAGRLETPPASTITPARPSNPLAPSLPLLTDEEEDRLDQIIDRFSASDIGRLRGEEGKKARRDFDRLGPEAIPALIRGMNRAALIGHSCPAVSIAKKLSRFLATTNDLELLDFARENIGLGVVRSPHAGVLQNLKFGCMLRKNALMRIGITQVSAPATVPPERTMTLSQLAEAAGKEQGPQLQKVLVEIERRQGDMAITALGVAASSYEPEIQKLAQRLLTKHLGRQSAAALKALLKHGHAEVRREAARWTGEKRLPFVNELIDLLGDENDRVRKAAHQALVRLNKGTDLGPSSSATKEQQEAAILKWRQWWQKRNSR